MSSRSAGNIPLTLLFAVFPKGLTAGIAPLTTVAEIRPLPGEG